MSSLAQALSKLVQPSRRRPKRPDGPEQFKIHNSKLKIEGGLCPANSPCPLDPEPDTLGPSGYRPDGPERPEGLE